MSGLDPLDEAQAAVERRDWQLALDVLAASGSEATGAEGFELRARAAYGSGDFEAAVSAWEDLHSLLVAAGDDIGAARAAAMISDVPDDGHGADGARCAGGCGAPSGCWRGTARPRPTR